MKKLDEITIIRPIVILLCVAIYFVITYDILLNHRIILTIAIEGLIVWYIAKKYNIKILIYHLIKK